MANIGFATLSVIPSLKGMEQTLQSQLTGPAAAAGAKAGQEAGQGVSKGLLARTFGTGPKLLKNLGLLGVGLEAFHAAHAVEQANNLIIRATGASGKVADELETSFRNVAKSGPASFETVATALSEVFQRTGLTGKGLETLTRQVVSFNRITKDSPIDVRELTKSLAGFNIPASKMGEELDRLFVLSQRTGVPLQQLVQEVGAAGPIARQFGFSLDFTAGFLAQLNKAGLDSSAIIPGLRKAFITFAKEGKSPAEGLRTTINAIDELVRKGDKVGAQKLAVKLFGARGAGIVDAAVAGKISIQSLTATFAPAGDSILQTAKKTGTLSGKLGTLKNNAQLALASIGKPVLEGATSALSAILPVVQGIAAGFEHIPGPVKAALVGFVGFAVALGPITKIAGKLKTAGQALGVFGKLPGLLGSLGGAFKAFGSFLLANPIFLIAAAVIAIGVVIFKFRRQIGAALGVIGHAFSTAGKAILGFFSGIARSVGHFFGEIGHFIETGARAIVGFFASLPSRVLGVVKRFLPIVLGILFPPAAIVVALIKFWGPISRFFTSLPGRIIGLLADAGRWLFNLGRDIVLGLGRGIAAVGSTILHFFTGLPGQILRLLGNLGRGLFNLGRSIVTHLVRGLGNVAGAVIGLFASMPAKIGAVFAPLGGLLGRIFGNAFNAVKSIAGDAVGFIIQGFRFMANIFLSVVGSIIHAAAVAFGWVPFIGGKLRKADKAFRNFKDSFLGTLEDMSNSAYGWGGRVVKKFADGMTAHELDVAVAAKRISSQLSKNMRTQSPAEEGPLSLGGGPEGWGERFTMLFARGLTNRLNRERDRLQLQLGQLTGPLNRLPFNGNPLIRGRTFSSLYAQGLIRGLREEENRLTAQLARTVGIFQTKAPAAKLPVLTLELAARTVPSPAVPARPADRNKRPLGGDTFNLHFHNPVPEPASSSLRAALRTIELIHER